ncbi:MAG: hypothetical protein HY22_12500 [[Candidatus Thermochlorobacteriaceae] bacterium GBChlB]|nr:MAG: hypothetical protein HY22_12500 [[Candidatus Thermochlorobacteriaceae] bacterium GBChlB]
MNVVNLYTAKHADAAHILEFFTKRLMREGESPLAVFDGIFYEAKNERVGGFSFHDYLVITNKSVYLWARGIHKDYLDRFNLGCVSFAAKEKDREFATLDLTISRENNEPIFLIFDYVPISEVKNLMLLHVNNETEIESAFGKAFLGEIPDDLAQRLKDLSGQLLPQREILVPDEAEAAAIKAMMNGTPPNELFEFPNAPLSPMQSAENIGGTKMYGDNLLNQIRQQRQNQNYQSANGNAGQGYSAEFLQGEPRWSASSINSNPFSKFDVVSMKRAEAIVRDMFNAIPEEYRNQAKKDLEQMPERWSHAVLALNELLGNISKNRETQNFVMQVIETSVKNDGILGAIAKTFSTFAASASAQAAAMNSNGTANSTPSTQTESTQGTQNGAAQDREPDSSAKQATDGMFGQNLNASSQNGNGQRKKIKIKIDSN